MAKSDWVESLIKACEDQGFRVERKTKGYMVFPLDKSFKPVAIHLTNSDWRAEKNAIAMLKRAGLNYPV